MRDLEFDALLAAACGEARKEDLSAAGMAAQKKPRRKALRTALVAAVACMVLCIGVAAEWPQLQMALKGNAITMEATNVARSGELADAQRPVFGYMPAPYTVIWEESKDDFNIYGCEITDGNESIMEVQHAYVYSYPVDAKVTIYAGGIESDDPVDEEFAQREYEKTIVLETIEDLTLADLETYDHVVWTDGGNTYRVYCATMDRKILLEILKNIE